MSDQRHDQSAELATLAACIESKTARDKARAVIVAADFYQPAHEAIFAAMSTLDRHKRQVDFTTVAATIGTDRSIQPVIIELITTVGIPDHVSDYAAIVRAWSTKRKVETMARRVLQEVQSTGLNAPGFAADVANRFAGLRDAGLTDDVTALTVTELLEQQDDAPDWLIPGLLERRDRFMLTGEEGLGKSHMLRQFAILAAAGLHPFDASASLTPIRATIIDCENTWGQVRRKIRPAVDWARRRGTDPSDRIMVDCTSRMDITRDKDLSRIHQLLDAQQPDLVVIGPLYRLVPRALQTDDDTAPVLAALDTIRDRGCALLMEAHAGHAVGKAGAREMRPRGSSSLLGWPEFGYGMRSIGAEGYCDLVQWRGPREDRAWPTRLVRGDGYRWVPNDHTYAWDRPA